MLQLPSLAADPYNYHSYAWLLKLSWLPLVSCANNVPHLFVSYVSKNSSMSIELTCVLTAVISSIVVSCDCCFCKLRCSEWRTLSNALQALQPTIGFDSKWILLELRCWTLCNLCYIRVLKLVRYGLAIFIIFDVNGGIASILCSTLRWKPASCLHPLQRRVFNNLSSYWSFFIRLFATTLGSLPMSITWSIRSYSAIANLLS